jgi:hypothetical protein
MKTIKQIREEYDNQVLVQTAPDELMLEGRESSVIKSSPKGPPTPSNMPAMLMFRRIAYRQYPDKQFVALYYSKLVNKYLSIPFGPDGNLNLSEAVIHDGLEEGAKWEAVKGGLKGATLGAVKGAFVGAAVAPGPGTVIGTLAGAGHGAYKGAKKAYNKAKENNMEEDWSDAKYKNPEGGLTKAGVMRYRRENPGSKLQTAVTTKPSKLKKGSKAANRRKSFCARMGGMKKRLTSAKTARDPDSRINKALRKWNCEESFKSRLDALREEKVKPWMDYSDLGGAVKTATELTPGASAYQKAKEGDYVGAAKSGAIDLALGAGAKVLQKAYKGYKALKAGKAVKPSVAAAAGAAAGAAATKASSPSSSDSEPAITRYNPNYKSMKTGVKGVSSTKFAKDTAPHLSSTRQSKHNADILKSVKENKISDIQNMINEGVDNMDLSINGRTVTLNNSMAKKIIRVYESVNTKNKKIVESMLNEDLDSFKKLLNFSIKA